MARKCLRVLFCALAIAAAAFLLFSCDNLRQELFGFRDTHNIPRLDFWPKPEALPFTQPMRINVGTAIRFRDWRIRYTTDPSATLEEPEKWMVYIPDKGIMLGATTDLRAVAYRGDADGMSEIAEIHYEFDLPNIQVYVDPNGPENANGISPDSPFPSLQAGIDLAASLFETAGSQVVVCARQGEYRESPVMRPGVILRGSYDGNWTLPVGIDTAANTDLITSSSIVGSVNNETVNVSLSAAIPLHALRFPSGMEEPTEVQYFRIRAADGGTNSAAVLIESPYARIYRCRIEGGNSGGASAGVWVRGGGVVAENSNLRGRSVEFPGDSYGALSLDSILDLRGSRVESGRGPSDGSYFMGAYGIYSEGSPGLSELRVSGGCDISAEGEMGTQISIGIAVSRGNAVISDSAIRSGNARASGQVKSFGISLNQEANAQITANVIRAGSAFTNTGVDTANSIGISTKGVSNVSIQSNAIYAGLSEDNSDGIRVIGQLGQMNILGNDIQAGRGVQTRGLATDGAEILASGRLVIERNRIWGGEEYSTGNTYGLYIDSIGLVSPFIIRNNVIHGGLLSSGGTHSYGVYLNDVTGGPDYLALLGNTIWSGGNAGGSEREHGVYINSTSTLRVDVINNIIDSQEAVFQVLGAAARPRYFWNNCLYSSNGGLYPAAYVGGTAYGHADLNIANTAGIDCRSNIAVETSPRFFIGWTGNYPADAGSFSGQSYHLLNTDSNYLSFANGGYDSGVTPALPAGISDGFDFDGTTPRDEPWTIGACE